MYLFPFAVIILASILSPTGSRQRLSSEGSEGRCYRRYETHHDCETFSGSETFIFTPVSLDLNMYALFPGVIAVYLWLARCELESGRGGETLMCFLLTGWKERGPPQGQSTSVLLKLASLLIYLCLNRTKEPNTVALRTFLASARKRWHASLFWRES